MGLIEQIIARAKSNKQRIVLPEAEEERTLTAADRVLADDIADLILIGNPEKVNALAKEKGLTNISKATLIDPLNYEKSEEMAQLLQKLREKKGMTIEKARELVKDPLYLGCMIIKTEGADGQISGALSTTGETLRPALQIIKCGERCARCGRCGSDANARCQPAQPDCRVYCTDGALSGRLRRPACGYALVLDERQRTA